MKILMRLMLFASLAFGSKVIAQEQIYLHYDVAQDFDDLHAMVAARQVLEKHGRTAEVIIGTHSYKSVDGGDFRYRRAAVAELAPQVFGANGYREVAYNFAAHDDAVAAEWDSIILNGGTVVVAEGGPSDFTEDVLRKMNQDRSMVTVVQHSAWNENMTLPSALAYVKAQTNYIKIADGNVANSTADLSFPFTNARANTMRATDPLWSAAFDVYDNLVDFSDTVELLHILGVGLNQVSDINSFADYVSGTVIPPNDPDNPPVTIVIEAEDYVTRVGVGEKQWEEIFELGESGMQLLPDTRVIHSDPLLHGVNFWDNPEGAPELTYTIDVEYEGLYDVEVRVLSRGTEDNGAHVGVNGDFERAQRVQWCTGKNQWTYSSALRLDSNHCGVPGSAKAYLSAGENTINLRAREDGLYVDKIRLSLEGGVVAPDPVSGQCSVVGDNLSLAVSAYNQQCVAQGYTGNRDCDPIGGGRYACGNYNNPTGPVTPQPDPLPDPLPDPDEPPHDCAPGDSDPDPLPNPLPLPDPDPVYNCAVGIGAPSLGLARQLFAENCAEHIATRDCDPINGQWVCASQNL